MEKLEQYHENQPSMDLDGLVDMMEKPSCTYSVVDHDHIKHNTAFAILFKGRHPLDVIQSLPEKIRIDLSEGLIRSRKVFTKIEVEGKRFSTVEVLPVGREYLLKFEISQAFKTDYKQIFEIIFEKSPLGILLVDKNLRFIAANNAVCKMTGYSLQELKQKTFMDITHPEDLDKNLPLTKKLYSEEIGSFSIQKRYIKKDGSIIWINLVTSLTKDHNGEFLGGMGIVEDITDKLNIEQQRNQLLHSLRETNKELIDSLAYARNIQNTLLPRENEFKKFFPNHFIYYYPRDIVGGDFYWIRSHGNKVYFAVADCTGHGVPGAFISIIGNYRLNLVFEKYKDQGPGVILEKLNNIIAYSFRSGYYNVSHHGMDIAMCSYDTETGMLEFAGANNSMLLVRKNVEVELGSFLDDQNQYRFMEDDLLEIKADKQSIGTYKSGMTFRNHQVQTKSGDRIYLYSDGYPDQFGGPKAKKLKLVEFKRAILAHSQFDFRKQRNSLHQFRKDWQGDLQQIDDICVLGIEF